MMNVKRFYCTSTIPNEFRLETKLSNIKFGVPYRKGPAWYIRVKWKKFIYISHGLTKESAKMKCTKFLLTRAMYLRKFSNSQS